MCKALPLFEGLLIELLVIVGLGDVLRLGLAGVVHEGSVTVRVAFLVLDVAEHVIELRVVIFCELDLLGQVIRDILVGATLARLVCLVLLGTHFHDVLDPALDHSALDVVYAEDELEQLA